MPMQAGTPGLGLPLDAFAGVGAVMAAPSGDVRFANGLAAALIEHGRLKPEIRAQVEAAIVGQSARFARAALAVGGDVHRYDLTMVPALDGDVLVLARDTTLEASLIAALTASRELFRDLASLAIEFAFETDEQGAFTWVSPRGALGYSAAELHGAKPEDVFGQVAGIETFVTAVPVEDTELWLRAKDGSARCLLINALCVQKAASQERRATRGIARDVTALRAHERQAWRIKRRDDLAAAIVDAMRAEIEPARILSAAAAALKTATRSDQVAIAPAASAATVTGHSRVAGARLEEKTFYRGAPNGAVTLTRDHGRDDFGEEEHQLLAAILPQLGVAIALCEILAQRAKEPQCSSA